jgi:hypothetical protein
MILNTYDDGRSTEYLRAWANEAALSIGCTEAFDIREEPGLNAKLNSSTDDSCNNLADEHWTGGNLHVVACLVCQSSCE